MTCRRPVRALHLVTALATIAATLPARPASADVTAPVLKAAFLYNFTKFTDWPVDALTPRQPLTMCVVGEVAVAAALEQTIRSGGSDAHPLSVRVLAPDGAFDACNVLYVGRDQLAQVQDVLARLRDRPVLTVSDAESFAASGGIAELIADRNQMRFAINTAAARRARLHLSSRLLRLAELVGDDRHEH